jgi:hypothetical protein
MNAHVISLPGSTRRPAAGERAAGAGLTVRFFDAVDALASEDVSKLLNTSARSFQARYGRAQTRGELACLLSHQRLCRMLTSEEAAYQLILEDDFIPLAGAGELDGILAAAAARRADVVLLGYAKVDDDGEAAINLSNPLMEARSVPNGGRLLGYRCLETTCGALSYLCSRRFLEAMAGDNEYGRLADDWRYHEKLGLSIMHVKPLCFREDYRTMTSSLEGDRSALRAPSGTRLPPFLRPFWRRGWGTLRKLQYHLDGSFRGH